MRPAPPPSDPALAGFAALDVGRAHLLVRRGYEEAAERLADFERLLYTETVGGGRAAHPVILLPGGERVVVRRYRRGGWVRHVNRALYFGGNRAFDELRATERARAAGVRTPVVVAAIERPALVGYRAALATLLVPGARDLAAWLGENASGEARRTVLREAGRQIGTMHAGGVAHPDVNLRNLLVAGGSGSGDGGSERAPAVYLLDFDRAEVTAEAVPNARRERDLRRLARSARKLAVAIGGEEWAAMKEGYGEGWPPELDLARPPTDAS
ncbi:MAG TPA: lipopolysaccharide kinase InaA family protein [Longimicrobium sp.]|nr:lipopolysaccharide kinase InaA family protein [Longimicrobium sp.]